MVRTPITTNNKNNRPPATPTTTKNKHQSGRDHVLSKADARDKYLASKPTCTKNTSSPDSQNAAVTDTLPTDPDQVDNWSTSIDPLDRFFPSDQWLRALYHKLDENPSSALEFLTLLEKNASSTTFQTNNNNNAQSNNNSNDDDDDDDSSLSSDTDYSSNSTDATTLTLPYKQAQTGKNTIINNNITTMFSPREHSANTWKLSNCPDPTSTHITLPPSNRHGVEDDRPSSSPAQIAIRPESFATSLLHNTDLCAMILRSFEIWPTPTVQTNSTTSTDLPSAQTFYQQPNPAPLPQMCNERVHWLSTLQAFYNWVTCPSLDKHRVQHLIFQFFNTSWDMWELWIGIHIPLIGHH